MKDPDFENDLMTGIKTLSREMGFRISFNQSLDKVLLDYLTVRTKVIEPKVREVLVNPDFQAIIAQHAKRREINAIIDIARRGDNLNIFQSKRLLQTNFHDHLQSEWNIYHFHISLEKDKKSDFVKQVNSLLFAYITDTQIVFLGTETHKEGVFGDVKWIECLHDHFPSVIEKYKDNSILDISPNVNSIERQTLWNKGFSLGMTKIKGVIYHNPGIGRMTSGHSMTASMTALDIQRWIYKLKKQLTESLLEVCTLLNVLESNAGFKIRFGDVTLELFEASSGIKILEFPQILLERQELIKRINTPNNNS